VFLDKLEAGLLLFQTPQGLVPVELSTWQRVYLLWTFRNFHQLSLPLLNSRQVAMVRAIARKNANGVIRSYDPWLVIGVIENFKLPAVPVAAAPAAKLHVLPVVKNAADWKTKEEWPKPEAAVVETEILANSQPGGRLAPKIAWSKPTWFKPAWSRFSWSRLSWPKLVWPRLAWPRHGLPRFAWPKLSWARFTWPRPTWPKLVSSRWVTALGLLFLCIGSVIAWHRIDAIAGSEAHSQPRTRQIDLAAPSNTPTLRETAALDDRSALTSRAFTATTSQGRGSAVTPLRTQKAVADLVKPASTLSAIAAIAKQKAPYAVPTSKTAISSLGSGIQATRPPLHSVYPDYLGVEARGVVVLTAEVDSGGMVHAVKVVRGNRALAAAAVRAVRQWSYRPYFKDGKAVSTETNIVISFFSDDAISMSFPPSIPAER
jgi:TonB family protein